MWCISRPVRDSCKARMLRPEVAVATTVTPRVCRGLAEERPDFWGSPPEESEPKPGMVTMPLPPLMSTPRTGGVPEGALPAPPGPALGEMPPFELASEPFPAAAFPAPSPAPFIALPVPFPRPMLLPVPAPPRPALSPPEGDIDREPALPPFGTAILEPGWLEITAPALGPLPPLVGGVRFTPGSSEVP